MSDTTNSNSMPSGPGKAKDLSSAAKEAAKLELKKFQIIASLPGGLNDILGALNLNNTIGTNILKAVSGTTTTSESTSSTTNQADTKGSTTGDWIQKAIFGKVVFKGKEKSSPKLDVSSVNDLNNLKLDEDQVDLLTRLLNNIPSQDDAEFLKGKPKDRPTLLDKDTGKAIEKSAKGLMAIVKLAGMIEPGTFDGFAEGVGSVFESFAAIPTAALKNMFILNALLFTTALGLTAMAYSLVQVAEIPFAGALAGLGLITTTAGILFLAGASGAILPITLGAAILPIMGLAVLGFAAPMALGLKLLSNASDGVDVLDTWVLGLKNLASVNYANLILGTVALGYLPIIIASNAFALRLMPTAGTENFGNYISNIKTLAEIPNLGSSLAGAAAGITAITAAMLLVGAGDLVGSILDLGTGAVKGLGALFGMETDHNPFQVYIDLASHGDIGSNLTGTAKGITAIRAAMLGEGSGFLGGLNKLAGTIASFGSESLKGIGGLFGLDMVSNPFKAYIELSNYGPQLAMAGQGISDLAAGFKSLEDFNDEKAIAAANSIRTFIDTIGIENVGALGAVFSGFNNASITVPTVTAEMTTVHDAIIRKDGSIVHLDPADNVYATVNDIGQIPIDVSADPSFAQGFNIDNSDLINEMKSNSMRFESMKDSLDALIEYLKENGLGEVSATTIVQNRGYSESKLKPTEVME